MELLFLALWILPTPLSVLWWCYECGMLDDYSGMAGVFFAMMFIVLGFMIGIFIGPFGVLIFGAPTLYEKLSHR